MAVYYKFKSAKDYDSIPIAGQFISVAHLKERIFYSKHLGRGKDFNLVVSNAQTNEEYVDAAFMIPKNTSVLIRRVPGWSCKPIVIEKDEPEVVEDKVEDLPPPSSSILVDDSSTMKYPEESEWDEFVNDMYAIPEVEPAQQRNPVVDVSPACNVDEDIKIKALIDNSALDWSRQTQDAYGAGKGFGRSMGGRTMGGRGFGRGGLECMTPPEGYICHRCKVSGHFIQHCPTNGDPDFDVKRVKPSTGIPKSMLMAAINGSYALPSGVVAVLKRNESAFEKQMEGLSSTRPISDLPPELRCPVCKEVMKDAVLTSKCCCNSFCYKCIRDYIITKSMCVCGVANVLADDLLPNKTVRETISRILESTTNSSENPRSGVQVQDMESVRHVPHKVPSPTLSAASKGIANQPSSIEYSLDTKEVVDTSEGKVANVAHSLEKKSAGNADPCEATPESVSAKEALSAVSVPVPEEVQEKLLVGEQGKKKKKKKTCLPGSAADLQWRAYHDFGAENFSGMPLDPSAFNPYWAGGMPLGFDGCMPPFSSAMPYMGFTPSPFDVPFGGILPQDPFAAHDYMMLGVPGRDLSELGIGSMGMNQGPPIMSREEFEARKADLRRKREIERLGEREQHCRDRGGEVRSSGDVPSVEAKHRLMSQAATVNGPDQSNRAGNSEKDWRALSHHSPPRPGKRRASDHHVGSAATDEAVKAADRKQKGSIFSRISFSGPDKSSSKKRKLEPANGAKEREVADRPLAASNGYQSLSSSSVEGWRGGGYEHESSEEYHFKRRPSSWREVEDGWGSRGLRERDYGLKRPAVKRR